MRGITLTILTIGLIIASIGFKTGSADDVEKPPSKEVEECVEKHKSRLLSEAKKLLKTDEDKKKFSEDIKAISFFIRKAEKGDEYIVKIQIGKLFFHMNVLVKGDKDHLRLQHMVGPKAKSDKLEYVSPK